VVKSLKKNSKNNTGMKIYSIEYISRINGELYSDVKLATTKDEALKLQNANIESIGSDVGDDNLAESLRDKWHVVYESGDDVYITNILEQTVGEEKDFPYIVKEIPFVEDEMDCERGVLLDDGRIIPIIKNRKIVVTWETPINLETGMMIPYVSQCDAQIKGYTCLNELKENGKIKRETCAYKEYEIRMGYIRSMSDKRIEAIIKEFKREGFNVTRQAILYCYVAYRSGFKSGYRDEENGYHLFCPNRLNPFRLSATSLLKDTDWQTTYTC
jgi:hypothetical protein